MPSEDPLRPPSGEFPGLSSFASERERMARLEADMEANGEGLKRLEEALSRQKESFDDLRKGVETDRVQLATQLGEIKGALKMLIALGSVALAVVTIGLTIIGLVLRH